MSIHITAAQCTQFKMSIHSTAAQRSSVQDADVCVPGKAHLCFTLFLMNFPSAAQLLGSQILNSLTDSKDVRSAGIQ